MEKIIMYSTGCPKCKVLKTKLDSKNIEYETVTDTEQMLGLGITEVPMLKVGDELLDFSQAVRFINER